MTTSQKLSDKKGNIGGKPVSFQRQEWVQAGVKRIRKTSTNITISGTLEPAVLERMKKNREQSAIAAAVAARDWTTLHKIAPECLDLTTELIRQWEFPVRRAGYSVMVTAYCLESCIQKPKPAVVYFHGGGWFMGSRICVENAMRLLAQYSAAIVFSVEYRLAPEYRFPCATDDCWKVLKYIHSHTEEFHIERGKIVVSGDSAGGNMAAACARRDRNMRSKILALQVLIYPVLSQIETEDWAMSEVDFYMDHSQEKWIKAALHSMRYSLKCGSLYVNNALDRSSPDASPLLDTDFEGLPKTLLVSAEFDYLTRQAERYGERLAQAGVDVTQLLYSGVDHGFMNEIGRNPQAADLIMEMASSMKML